MRVFPLQIIEGIKDVRAKGRRGCFWLQLSVFILILIAIAALYFFPRRSSQGNLPNHPSPAITPFTRFFHPYQTISITAQNFAPNETVVLYFDIPKGSPPGFLTCDNTGKCAGSVATYGGFSDRHTLIGIGEKSRLVAKTQVIFIPGILLSTQEAGQGVTVELDGSSFTAHEKLQVDWGKSLLLSKEDIVTDDNGSFFFYFNVPLGIPAGLYPITVTRLKVPAAKLVTWFKLLPPRMTFTGGILNGQPLDIHLSGFMPGERVTVSWSANGKQILVVLGIASSGMGGYKFIPPHASPGIYTLIAQGNTSNLEVRHIMSVGPGFALSPLEEGNPGGTISIVGGGYAPRQKVDLYFQRSSYGMISTIANFDGTFAVPLSLPKSYDPTASYYIHAVSKTSTGVSDFQQPFFFARQTINLDYDYAHIGEMNTFRGNSFGTNEKVELFWKYGQPDQTSLGTVMTGSNGQFSFNFIVPPAEVNSVTVAAIGRTSGLEATHTIYINTRGPSASPLV